MPQPYLTPDPTALYEDAMRYALAQINPVTGDINGNQQQIRDTIRTAEAYDADVVVFPEMALTGYCVNDLVEDDVFVQTNKDALTDLARDTDETAAIVGFIDEQDGQRYNAAAVLQHGEIQGVVHKTLLPNYRYFDDKRYFSPGDDESPVTITVDDEDVVLGVSICEDMWDTDYDHTPITDAAAQGADILININASPYHPGKRTERMHEIERHVKETGLPFLYTNTVGAGDVNDTVLAFDGESMAYNAAGDLVAVGDRFTEDLVLVDLDSDPVEPADYPREAGLYEALVMALNDYAKKTGFTHAIQSVSGGIDSALGLALTVDAFGADNVTAYTLPSDVNPETGRARARQVADNLGVDLDTIPVEDAYTTILDAFEEHAHTVEHTTSRENVYARVRGVMLMLAANEQDALLIANGNETELALGYATLYGDMAGGLAPLGDLSKRDVYALAAYVNDRHGTEVIPQEIIDATPSAELSVDQEDPFDYDVVAPIITAFLEDRTAPTTLIDRFAAETLDATLFPDDTYDHYDVDTFETVVWDAYDRFRRNAFKRVQAPPVIAVSDRAFGTDFREPLLNAWTGRTERDTE